MVGWAEEEKLRQFKSSTDKLNDFRETFAHKFLTNEEELKENVQLTV